MLCSLERNYKYELLTEHDLGVTIDLILPETYEHDMDGPDRLDPADEKLLEEELTAAQDKRRNMKHSQVHSFVILHSVFGMYGTVHCVYDRRSLLICGTH